MIDDTRLTGAADNLLADMRFAQTQAMKTNTPIVVTLVAGTDWSYTMNTVPSKTSLGNNYSGTALAADASVVGATPANTITFDPKRNTLTPVPAPGAGPVQLITLTSAEGSQLALEVTPESAMRLCSPAGFRTYPVCTP